MKWKPFYFDGNQAFGLCDTPAEWERVKSAYREFAKIGACASPAELLSCLECPRNRRDETPRFGFMVECVGPRTLREFFAENGMDAGEL